MSTMWDEVAVAEKENRRELVLQGSAISQRIDKNGLDDNIFKLVNINFLEISRTTLSIIQPAVGELVNLTSLVLCNNQLTEAPEEISKLSKLKLLDLSNNKIKSIPEEICSLTELDTFNVNMNQVVELPSIRDLKSLHILKISHNKLTSLPDGIFSENLIHLSSIDASENQIEELSSDVEDLPHLVTLDMSGNSLTQAPPQLCLCPKLKELNLKGNNFKDRRFGKMVEQECSFKSLIDYLNNIFKKENQKSGKEKESKKKKKKGKKAADEEEEELVKNLISVLRFPSETTGVVIQADPGVQNVRPYIVCCIVRSLDLKSKFKSFISLQTKLHDGVCQKRQAGTIATHDLKSVKMPLRYTVRPPQELMIVPLFKMKEVSGEKLFEDLRKEAEEIRKEKKRNTFSGIHKYLDLLQDKPKYPCLQDKDGVVISFPPITNSDKTKISKDTTDILVEVTSSTSLDVCKQIMDELLYKMLEAGLGSVREANSTDGAAGGSDSESDDGGVTFKSASGAGGASKLVVEQVKVIDFENVLKVLYPSRTDLANSAIEVIRNFD